MFKHFILLLINLIAIEAFAQETSGWVKTADHQLFYRTYGKGKPILIINGGPGMNSNGFVALAQKLSNHHQTIVYDQRGTGKSILKKIDGTTITMGLMVDDIEQLRRHLNIEKLVILGHSFGGMLASYYATIHPNRIEKLILSSSGGIDLELRSYAANEISNRLSKKESASLDSCNQAISREIQPSKQG